MRPPVHRRAGGGKPETTSNLENNEFLHRCCRLRTADSQDSRIKLCHGRLSSCLEIGSARTISILSPSKDAPGDQDLVELGAKTVIAVSSPLPGAPASSQLAGNHAVGPIRRPHAHGDRTAGKTDVVVAVVELAVEPGRRNLERVGVGDRILDVEHGRRLSR